MHIIHISGMPGSGKSTLGEKIAHTFVNSDVRVIDTDDLIVRNTPNGNELLELEKLSQQQDPGGLKYNTRWREIFSHEIQWNIDKSNEDGMKILVFVGILDHFGHQNDPIEIRNATHRYYIDISTQQLLFQFYTRYAKLFHNENDSFWNDLANDREHIPSSQQYILDIDRTKKWHIEHGYVAKTANDILSNLLIVYQRNISRGTEKIKCRMFG